MTLRVDVVLRVDDRTSATPPVRGELRSRYGRYAFSGWLELLGHLEALVDRASSDGPPPTGGDATDGRDGGDGPTVE